jgi:hypothetical protein
MQNAPTAVGGFVHIQPQIKRVEKTDVLRLGFFSRPGMNNPPTAVGGSGAAIVHCRLGLNESTNCGWWDLGLFVESRYCFCLFGIAG